MADAPHPSQAGFDFYCVEFVSSGLVEDHWECPELQVERIVEGVAYFDGIRHMNWGTTEAEYKSDGYLYYPEIGELTDLVGKLAALEKKWCRS